MHKIIISAREKLTVCDVYLPYMDINLQFIFIYGYFVTSLTAYYSCEDINSRYRGLLQAVNDNASVMVLSYSILTDVTSQQVLNFFVQNLGIRYTVLDRYGKLKYFNRMLGGLNQQKMLALIWKIKTL